MYIPFELYETRQECWRGNLESLLESGMSLSEAVDYFEDNVRNFFGNGYYLPGEE